jgi:homoserine kinase
VSSHRIRVPATSANLGPGFDCLGLALDRHLEIRSTPAERFTLEIRGEGADSLPRDDANLVVRAMLLALGADRPPPLALTMASEIPLARGLGSSAAATVAGLALGRLLRGESANRIDRAALIEQAVELEGHPDNVAPAVYGELVVSGIDAGQVVALRERWPDSIRLVLVVPRLAIETAAARRALPARIDFAAAAGTAGKLARLLAALHGGEHQHLRRALEDGLHEPFRLSLVPGLGDALAAMRRHPAALGAYLSGSGSTLAALVTDDGADVGQAATAVLAGHGIEARTLPVDVDRSGLVIDSDQEAARHAPITEKHR